MKNWIQERITWLDANMPGNCIMMLLLKYQNRKNIFLSRIYPNPASNNLTIDLGDLTGLYTTIRLYDPSSKLIFENQTTSSLKIDVSGFTKGMYSLVLSNEAKF